MSRYIDADALEKTLGDWIREHWTEALTGDDAGVEFADMIDCEKTVDTVQAAHAHWIKGMFADITCSNCDFPLCVPDSIIPKLVYCPHCGAKMEEGENDENKNEMENVEQKKPDY